MAFFHFRKIKRISTEFNIIAHMAKMLEMMTNVAFGVNTLTPVDVLLDPVPFAIFSHKVKPYSWPGNLDFSPSENS